MPPQNRAALRWIALGTFLTLVPITLLVPGLTELVVDAHGGIRASFPSACLVVIGLHLACRGAGRFGIDRRLERSRDLAP